ncbi:MULTISPECIES: hypothetical protein [Pedobacter]|uniref:Uncharacterized protein n=1 Tax=Pedobacter kyungheensis TaxID=1069985 RepID=A0A0C1DB67_9SPHI|nr:MULTISPECIES: hypothetical protein [Pedobacter]KIA94711.1 hypothetical protein OC25_08550 [Pedobacter kyungheensis]
MKNVETVIPAALYLHTIRFCYRDNINLAIALETGLSASDVLLANTIQKLKSWKGFSLFDDDGHPTNKVFVAGRWRLELPINKGIRKLNAINLSTKSHHFPTIQLDRVMKAFADTFFLKNTSKIKRSGK